MARFSLLHFVYPLLFLWIYQILGIFSVGSIEQTETGILHLNVFRLIKSVGTCNSTQNAISWYKEAYQIARNCTKSHEEAMEQLMIMECKYHHEILDCSNKTDSNSQSYDANDKKPTEESPYKDTDPDLFKSESQCDYLLKAIKEGTKKLKVPQWKEIYEKHFGKPKLNPNCVTEYSNSIDSSSEN